MKITNDRLVLDNNLPVRYAASPNHSGALTEKAFIIMHYTEGANLQGAVDWMTNPISQVASHLVIGRDGEVVQLLPFTTIGWHAGASVWRQYSGLNAYSVGIELDNPGVLKRSGDQWISGFGKIYPESEVLVAAHKAAPTLIYGWIRYTDIQLKTAAEVVAALIRAYGFREILGHDDVSPKRKWDPGPAFPMDQFRINVKALIDGEVEPPPPPPPPPLPPGNTPMHYKVENLDTGQIVEYTWSTAFKPIMLLPVPYVSQIGSGADVHQNDCGAAAAVMLISAYLNIKMTPDEFYTKFAISGDPFLSVSQLRNAMTSLGLMTDFRATLTTQDLFGALAAGKPPIVLLRYKVLSDAGLTEKTFAGPHFAVVVGMDIKYIYLHDPLYTNPSDGNAHAYPLDTFWTAWKDVVNDPIFPGPERGAILPTVGIGFKMFRTVKVTQSTLNIRSGAGISFPVVGLAKKGELYNVTREMSGWGEIGENRWFSLAYTQPV